MRIPFFVPPVVRIQRMHIFSCYSRRFWGGCMLGGCTSTGLWLHKGGGFLSASSGFKGYLSPGLASYSTGCACVAGTDTRKQTEKPGKRENDTAPKRWKSFSSAPEGTRTPNLLIRSQMLYPLSYERFAYKFNTSLSRYQNPRIDNHKSTATSRLPSRKS